ncbi:MFS transporter [Secundilactobacillus folii]|uniref:MFS transporter n=1 Tax=Secundilactobacillus folii TaxID=2678357 RepID=A0A7X2XWS2_9LACO|nr:MFS transporter [Secundilactobacillus folii]MTV83093.1 MFS transporter [Secundilactobacillus folii]
MTQKMSEKVSPKVIGAIIAAGLMSFCGVIIETAMNITFPTLMKEFNVTTNLVQWMTTIYLLVVASMVPLSATLKKRFKMRSLFLCAIIFFIAGVVIDFVATQFWMLLLGRAIQGFGTGIALPLMFNIILEQVPMSKRGTMMGIGTMITGVAPAIGPTFGGLVVSTLGWRDIFVFLMPLLLISLILGLLCIQQKVPTRSASIDQLSVILIILTFCGLIFGISNFGSLPFLSWQVIGALVLGIIAFIAFIIRSQHLDEPILDIKLFKNRRFNLNLLAFALVQTVALGLSFLLPNYIQLVNGNTALTAGLIVLPGAALGAIIGPFSGRIYDGIGAKFPLRLGNFLALIGVLGLALMGTHLSNVVILGWYTFFMLGIGLHFGNLMTNGLKTIDPVANSDGNAIFNTTQQFMAALGTSMSAAIVAASQTKISNQSTATAVGSTHAFFVLLLFLIGEMIAIWTITRPTRNHKSATKSAE